MAMTSSLGSLRESAGAYVRTRGLLLGALMLVTLVFRCVSMPPPPERDIDAIATMLGQSVGGTVKPDDFVWEGVAGFFTMRFGAVGCCFWLPVRKVQTLRR